jgi:hypothetical protein
MNYLYIIGNGFDLAHGLKTSYSDFLLDYLVESFKPTSSHNGYEDDLIKVSYYYSNTYERLKSIKSISEFFEKTKDRNISINFKNAFLNKLVNNLSEYRWVDIESAYFQELLSIHNSSFKNGIFSPSYLSFVNTLNYDFDCIKEALIKYLNGLNPNIVLIDEIVGHINSTSNKSKSLFLNFNYTSLINNYISSDDILINIHGELDKPEQIIFGYGDEMNPFYSNLESINRNEFLQNFKSFGYSKSDNYQRLMNFVDFEDFVIRIMGHSCGISDKVLLNTLFEHRNCSKIRVYYHQMSNVKDDYFEKSMEISRHFSASAKQSMRIKLVPKSKSVPLVSFKNT